MNLFLGSICVFFLMTSCDHGDFEYSQYYTAKGQELGYQDTLKFEFVPKKDSLHQLYVSVRYTDQYEFSNIWLKSYHGEESARINIPLFDKFGKPLGDCTGGLCTQTILWKEQQLTSEDTVRINFVQNMRKSPLKNISEVGLIVR